MMLRESNIDRESVLRELANSGIESRPIVAGNFTRNPAIKYLDYSIHGKLLVADWIHDRGFFVGNHHFDIQRELILLDRKIRDFCESGGAN